MLGKKDNSKLKITSGMIVLIKYFEDVCVKCSRFIVIGPKELGTVSGKIHSNKEEIPVKIM
jgi:hypothetical protein